MIKALSYLRTAGFLWLTLSLAHAAEWPATNADKKSGEVFKNLKVLNDAPSDLLLPSMQFITSSLGVHCEYCHVENAFDKDEKRPKQTARQMMRMVEEINKAQFKNQQKVTCYTCHRGSPKPLAVPVIASTPPQLLSESASDNVPVIPGQPSPAVVITKFLTALGGADAIASLNSLQETGTFHSDARAFPIELYVSRPGRSAARIHFPGADRITVFDGTSGSIAQPGHPSRPMTSAEVDAARMDSDLQFPLNINKVFSDLKVTGTTRLGSEKVVVLSGERPGLPPVEMYFGKTTGLLLRIVRYLPSALGLNPAQTDYSDYRKISAGVKIPFQWTSATPTGRFTVEIRTARANVSVPEALFSVSAGP